MPDLLPKKDVAAPPQTSNPSNPPGKTAVERQRIPMSVPMQKLEVPPISGYHLHWFRGDAPRIARAQQAGYEFVSHEEVDTNNFDLGGDTAASGNTDMGSRVSVISGDATGQDGQPERMVLMKIRDEWWEESQKILEDRNEAIAEAIRGGKVGTGQAGRENAMDAGLRYVKQADNLFTRRKRAQP